MATSKTIKPTNVSISIPAMTDVPDASVFSNCVDKLVDGVNTLQDDHFTAKGSAQSPVSDLSTIPLGFVGNITMAAALSPSGNTRSHSLIKWGLSQNRYHILAIDQYENRMYLYENYDGTPKGWREIPTHVYEFGGTSSNSSFSFPMANLSHAIVCIGNTMFSLYNYEGTIYDNTLPTGYTAAISNGIVTITRSTSTTFIIHGIVIGGTR